MAKGKGKLIVFEGTDGTGKSTQLGLASGYLQSRGHTVVTTREPTEGQYGQKIRSLYQNRGDCTPREELEHFLADRKEHVEQLLTPSIAAGKIVLCDRYYHSTIAYQGAIGFDVDELISLNSFAPTPDLALLFHAPMDTSQQRITTGRGETLNDFEQLDNLQKVATIFDSLTMPFIQRIDAGGTLDSVHKQVIKEIDSILISKEGRE